MKKMSTFKIFVFLIVTLGLLVELTVIIRDQTLLYNQAQAQPNADPDTKLEINIEYQTTVSNSNANSNQDTLVRNRFISAMRRHSGFKNIDDELTLKEQALKKDQQPLINGQISNRYPKEQVDSKRQISKQVKNQMKILKEIVYDKLKALNLSISDLNIMDELENNSNVNMTLKTKECYLIATGKDQRCVLPETEPILWPVNIRETLEILKYCIFRLYTCIIMLQ